MANRKISKKKPRARYQFKPMPVEEALSLIKTKGMKVVNATPRKKESINSFYKRITLKMFSKPSCKKVYLHELSSNLLFEIPHSAQPNIYTTKDLLEVKYIKRGRKVALDIYVINYGKHLVCCGYVKQNYDSELEVWEEQNENWTF